MATSTTSFGASKRESHDSSAYYARRMVRTPAPGDVGDVRDAPANVLDRRVRTVVRVDGPTPE